MVTKWQHHFRPAMSFSLFFVFVMFSASFFTWGQAEDPQPLKEKVTKFQKRLNLSDEQTAKVRDILLHEREQAVKDREKVKDDALELIRVAYDRRETVNKDIEALLESGQVETFRELVRMNPFDRDLFEYTQGLVLDDEQAFTVEGILIDYYNEVKMFMPGGPGAGRGEGPPDGEPGMESGGRMMPMGNRGGPMRSMIRRAESKRYWAIKKILTKEQEKLFKQLTNHRKKEIKERLKKMKERHS